MTFLYTARNHRGYVQAAIDKAQRELVELDKRERNLTRPDGFPRHTPLEERERRVSIAARRQEILAERDQVIETALTVGRNARESASTSIARNRALQANPIARLTAEQASAVAQLISLLEAGFSRSSPADVTVQIRAAISGGNRDQQIACLEVVQRQIDSVTGPVRDQYRALEAELLGKLQDSTLARETADLETDLGDVEQFLADVNEMTHPIRVAAEQERLVATGNYGARVSEPMPLHNLTSGAEYEMVEQV